MTSTTLFGKFFLTDIDDVTPIVTTQRSSVVLCDFYILQEEKKGILIYKYRKIILSTHIWHEITEQLTYMLGHRIRTWKIYFFISLCLMFAPS